MVPPLVPFAIATVFFVYLAFGGQLNPHAGGGLFFILVLSTSVIAALVECVLVPLSIVRLLKDPGLRTAANVWSVAFGGAFVLIVVLGAIALRWLLG